MGMLKKIGFGYQRRQWVKFCISSVNFSVMVNGSSIGYFRSQRDLRQGDLESAFLFILVIERLNDMIKNASCEGWLRGFEIVRAGRESLEITHLLCK